MTALILYTVNKKKFFKVASRVIILFCCALPWSFSCSINTQVAGTESETEIHLTGWVYDSCDNCQDTGHHPLGGVVVSMAALGFSDTTKANGAYEIIAVVQDSQLPVTAIKDSLHFFYNNDKKVSLPVAKLVDTVQDVYLVHHRVNYDLRSFFVRYWQVNRVEAEIVRKTGSAPDTFLLPLTFTQNQTYNKYVADTLFTKRANVIDTYTVQIRVYGEDGKIIGLSNPKLFTDLSDSVVFEKTEFDAGNLIPLIAYASKDSFEYGYTDPYRYNPPDRRQFAGDSVLLTVVSTSQIEGPFYSAIKQVLWDFGCNGTVEGIGVTNTLKISATIDTMVCVSADVVYFNNDTVRASTWFHATPSVPLPPNSDLIETTPIGLDYTDHIFRIDTASGMGTTRKESGNASYRLSNANRVDGRIVRVPKLRGAGSFTSHDTLVLKMYQNPPNNGNHILSISEINLQCVHGIFEYNFKGNAVFPASGGAWFRIAFPLSGNSDWNRTAFGTSPDLGQVTNIEIVVGGLNTETIWLDGLEIRRGN
jgi:hypothetical protein